MDVDCWNLCGYGRNGDDNALMHDDAEDNAKLDKTPSQYQNSYLDLDVWYSLVVEWISPQPYHISK